MVQPVTLEEIEGTVTVPQQNTMQGSVMSPDYKGQQDASLLPELLGLGGGILAGMTPQGRVLGALGRGGQAVASRLPASVRPYVPSLFGSSIGTALGTTAEQILTGEFIPSQFAANLAENAVWDVGGNLVFNIGGKAIRIGKEALTAANATQDAIPDAKIAAQKFLAQSNVPGATLSRAQLLGTPGEKSAEAVARGGTGATIFGAQEQSVQKAIEQGKKNFFDNLDVDPEFQLILSQGRSADYAAGSSFKTAIDRGFQALKDQVDPFYDTLSSQGKNVGVDFTGIKKTAQTELDAAASMSATGRAGSALTEEVARELRAIADIKGTINFSQAHQYRSTLLGRIRELEQSEVRPTRLIALLKSTVSQLEKQMDEGAKLFDPALKKQYDQVSKLYRESITELYPQTIVKALEKNPERVGESLFRAGNETETLDTIKAAARIENLTKGAVKQNQVLDSLRYGYIDGMFANFDTTADLARKLDKPEFSRGFNALFTDPKQREVITGMAEAARALKESEKTLGGVQARTVGAGLNLVALGTGGTLAYLNLTPDQQEKLKDNVPASVLTGGIILLTPRFMAKAMTDPDAVNALAKVTNPNRVTPAVYGAAVAKLAAYWNKAGLYDNEYINQVQQVTGTFVPQGQRAPQPVVPAQQGNVVTLEEL